MPPSRSFAGAPTAPGALDIACKNGITIRVHWTDQPDRWHAKDSEEVVATRDEPVVPSATAAPDG